LSQGTGFQDFAGFASNGRILRLNMVEPSQQGVTRLLKQAQSGDKSSLDELLPVVYQELRQLASSQLSKERPNHTLQPTALVHETYLRLIDQHSVDWRNRAHFFSIAAEMMRRILVNHAVNRNAQKRGSGETLLSLDEALHFSDKQSLDVVVLDEALTRLAEFDPMQARVVELRFFAGLTNEEVAEVLNVSESTTTRDFRAAKAWLATQLK
jgi:RNA polymerase sigma-70 factor, ECF subfamily